MSIDLDDLERRLKSKDPMAHARLDGIGMLWSLGEGAALLAEVRRLRNFKASVVAHPGYQAVWLETVGGAPDAENENLCRDKRERAIYVDSAGAFHVCPDCAEWTAEEGRGLLAEVRRLREALLGALAEVRRLRGTLFKWLHDEKWARLAASMGAPERDTYDHEQALRDSVVGALNRERDRNRVGRYGPFPETSG